MGRQKELERAQAIFKLALDVLPKGASDELYRAYVSFEKQHGDRDAIEEVVLNKRRFIYEDGVAKNARNYDVWFDYIRLEESCGDVGRIREVYEREEATSRAHGGWSARGLRGVHGLRLPRRQARAAESENSRDGARMEEAEISWQCVVCCSRWSAVRVGHSMCGGSQPPGEEGDPSTLRGAGVRARAILAAAKTSRKPRSGASARRLAPVDPASPPQQWPRPATFTEGGLHAAQRASKFMRAHVV